MFQCHVCGGKESRQDTVTHIFFINDKPVIVENVPGTVCKRCGESVFQMETVEKIREMIHGKAKPVKSVMTDVFEFA